MTATRKRRNAKGILLAGVVGSRSFVQRVDPLRKMISKKLLALDITDPNDEGYFLPPGYKGPPRQHSRVYASFNVPQESAKFIIELFATWIGTKVLDEIWKKIKGSFKFKTLEHAGCELQFKSSMDEFTIVVRFQASHEQFFQIVVNELVPKVIAQANAWVSEKGITHKYIIYNIRDAEYSRIPQLRDELESKN